MVKECRMTKDRVKGFILKKILQKYLEQGSTTYWVQDKVGLGLDGHKARRNHMGMHTYVHET